MILDTLSNAALYERLHPLFAPLFEYVRTHDLLNAPTGRIELDGDRLFINVNDATLVSPEEQKLEIHRRYIDVHFPLSSNEGCGWTPLSALAATSSDEPFNEESDFAVYSVPAQTYFTAQPGQFYIVYPKDAHAPALTCEEGNTCLRKLVAKVLI